jgi:hypothetical protein
VLLLKDSNASPANERFPHRFTTSGHHRKHFRARRHGFQWRPLRPHPITSPPLRSRRDSRHPLRRCSSPFHSVRPRHHAVHSCLRHRCMPAFRSPHCCQASRVVVCPRRRLVAGSSATSPFYFASAASLSIKLLTPHVHPPLPTPAPCGWLLHHLSIYEIALPLQMVAMCNRQERKKLPVGSGTSPRRRSRYAMVHIFFSVCHNDSLW